MQSEKMSVVMGMGFVTRWVHEYASPAKIIKVFLCALCDLWCKLK